jgi:uncharacterized protein YjbI with pentapeptide repeats
VQNQLEESQDQVAIEQHYHDLLFGSTSCGGPRNEFSYLDLENAFMPKCLAGANLSHTNLVHARLINADLPNTNLHAANLAWADLDEVVAWNADLSNANLSVANLSNADFTGANLSGVTWDHTTCPDYTNSSTNGTVPESCFGHGPGL